MKKIYLFITVIISILLSGCGYEEVTGNHLSDEQGKGNITGNTIIFTANMLSGDNTTTDPKTRISLVQDKLDVLLSWEEGDKLELCLVYGDKKVKQTSEVTNISADGKRADFTVTLPDDITDDEVFDLYGVYGGAGLSTTAGEEHIAVLPSAPWSGSLSEIQDKDLLMLTFKKTNLSKTTPDLSVNFQHIGSFFKIQLENIGETVLNNIKEVQLIADSDIWAYQSSDSETAKYDLADGDFVENTTAFAPILPFNISGTTDLMPDDVLELWGWYPPSQGEDMVWPEINLKIIDAAGTGYVTATGKPAREEVTGIGRVYHFFATYDEGTVSFFSQPETSFADPRDGYVYQIVTIGDQVWMAENLRYLPSVTSPATGSNTDPYFYVYDYFGTNVEEAKATENYQTYGVLYNWPAAMNGGASSSKNPSGVQGVCPDGWHLPSDAEWAQLATYLGAGAGGKLKEAGITHWFTPNTGATNETGFTSLPGGFRNSNRVFGDKGNTGHWWTATESSNDNGGVRRMSSTHSNLNPGNNRKEFGFTVRCLRD